MFVSIRWIHFSNIMFRWIMISFERHEIHAIIFIFLSISSVYTISNKYLNEMQPLKWDNDGLKIVYIFYLYSYKGNLRKIHETEEQIEACNDDYFLRKIRTNIFLQTIDFVMVLFPLIFSLSLFHCFLTGMCCSTY